VGREGVRNGVREGVREKEGWVDDRRWVSLELVHSLHHPCSDRQCYSGTHFQWTCFDHPEVNWLTLKDQTDSKFVR
jgi:hypothetical protein